MLFNTSIQTQNQEIHLSVLKDKKVSLFLKREDKIHPFVSGNKYRKLKYNIEKARQQQQQTLLTFGGAFSNHIVATAVAGKMNGFKTIGVIRGDELAKNLESTLANNTSLREAHKNGMEFLFVSRADYQLKTTPNFIANLKTQFGDFYVIPEGGTNKLAIQGCEEILTQEDGNFNYICCAVGTGGTIAGLINAKKTHQTVLGFPALKGNFLENEIAPFLKTTKNWSLQTDYHFGGYAKINTKLIEFINQFTQQTGILLDPIYTGKMVYGIVDLIQQDFFPENSKILVIHTGGIQGISGINQKLKKQGRTIIEFSSESMN